MTPVTPTQSFAVFASAQDMHVVLPLTIVSATGVLVLVADLLRLPRRNAVLAALSVAGIAAAFVLTLQQGFVGRQPAFGGILVADGVATFLGAVILLGSGLGILLSSTYLPESTTFLGEYYSLALFATVGMQIMAAAEDLVAVFVGIEILSLSLYVLSGFFRTVRRSTESALKYFLLGAFASAFLLYGIALLYGATGSTLIPQAGMEAPAFSAAGVTGRLLFPAGLALVVVGLAFKAGVVPFHMWVPDVYEGAPTAVTAFMSAAPKAASLAVLLRLFAGDLGAVTRHWVDVFLVLGVLTMTLGNVVALAQTNLKRMLAYSGIAHVGYMVTGIAAFSQQGSAAVLFYLAVYSFMNMGAFAVVVLMNRRGRYEFLDDYAGLAGRHPIVALALAVFMVSLAGFPPTAGFLGKLYLFTALVQAGLVPVAVVAVLNSVISVYYYLRVVVYMYMRDAATEIPSPGIGWGAALAVLISVAAVLALGVHPSAVVDWARISATPLAR
jgi:NADH-quinone oxidoreductase subunit N